MMSNEKRLWIIEARDGAWGANGICKGELVRCGECRRAIPFSAAGNRDAFCHCDLFDATMTRKDYCSYGERKEKEYADS